MIPVGQLRLLLTKAGLEYVITRVEGNVEHVNTLVAGVKDTDVDYQELMDDDGEGGVYIKFTNIETEESNNA